jgi:hypothetical protein
LNGAADDPASKKQRKSLFTDALQLIGGQNGWVNVGTLKPFIPVEFVIDNPAVDIFIL